MRDLGVTSIGIWLALLVGLAVIVPLHRARARAWYFAVLNVGFLTWVQGRWVALTLLFLLISYVAVLLVQRAERLRGVAMSSALLMTLTLFLATKAPWLAQRTPSSAVAWLSALGFSYVALRFLDELRSVRDKGHAPDFGEHINYLVPFYMLAAGPIQRFEDSRAPANDTVVLSFAEALSSLERIALGLFKKLVLAHVLERVFLTGFRSDGLYYVLEVQLFLPWLYLDFSSYSDIAIGMGRLLGHKVPENFDRPYRARDLIEFWQRWHITLSEWIQRNVFVPLQLLLQRRSPVSSPFYSSIVTICVSFGVCGLWHMVSWRYAAWGGIHALGVIASNWYRSLQVKRLGRAGFREQRERLAPRWIGMFLTYEFVAWSLAIVGQR